MSKYVFILKFLCCFIFLSVEIISLLTSANFETNTSIASWLFPHTEKLPRNKKWLCFLFLLLFLIVSSYAESYKDPCGWLVCPNSRNQQPQLGNRLLRLVPHSRQEIEAWLGQVRQHLLNGADRAWLALGKCWRWCACGLRHRVSLYFSQGSGHQTPSKTRRLLGATLLVTRSSRLKTGDRH